jgi:hypothetical protein
MRIHIELADELVRRIDETAGPRGRTLFFREAVEGQLDRRVRRNLIKSARGAIGERNHDWDIGPDEWVRSQRRADLKRSG